MRDACPRSDSPRRGSSGTCALTWTGTPGGAPRAHVTPVSCFPCGSCGAGGQPRDDGRPRGRGCVRRAPDRPGLPAARVCPGPRAVTTSHSVSFTVCSARGGTLSHWPRVPRLKFTAGTPDRPSSGARKDACGRAVDAVVFLSQNALGEQSRESSTAGSSWCPLGCGGHVQGNEARFCPWRPLPS